MPHDPGGGRDGSEEPGALDLALAYAAGIGAQGLSLTPGGLGVAEGAIGAHVLKPTLPGKMVVGPALTVRNIRRRDDPRVAAQQNKPVKHMSVQAADLFRLAKAMPENSIMSISMRCVFRLSSSDSTKRSGSWCMKNAPYNRLTPTMPSASCCSAFSVSNMRT